MVIMANSKGEKTESTLRIVHGFYGDSKDVALIEDVLKRAGFHVKRAGSLVGFDTDGRKTYIEALKYVWEHKVQGWHSQQHALVDNGICTLAEYKKALEDLKSGDE